MTLDQILTVEAIVKKGSFKAAAEYLYKSQPSISMAIKKLEQEYQMILFSRDEYRPTLTNDGKIFYEKAKILLRDFRELDSLAKLIGSGVEPEIKVSVDAISPLDVVLKFLRDFFDNHPKTKLTLRYEVLSGTIERLLDGEVDLAITPKPLFEHDLDYKSIAASELVPVISSELIKNKTKITHDFLRQHNQIILSDSARKIERVSTGILEGGKSVTVNEMSFKKELIMQGLGWGGLPLGIISNEIKAKKVTVIDTPLIKKREIEIFLVKMKNVELGPVAKELWESFNKKALK